MAWRTAVLRFALNRHRQTVNVDSGFALEPPEYTSIPLIWYKNPVRLVDRRRTAGGASQGGCRRREVWTEYLDTRQRVDLVGKLILKEFRKNWGIALS